jgi:hypothetical protein
MFRVANVLRDSSTTSIAVADVDRAPSIDPIANQLLNEGSELHVPVHASDPDNDGISVTLVAPPFASLIPVGSVPGNLTATIHLAPGFLDAGIYPANRVLATAGSSMAEVQFGIVVVNVNGPPVLSGPSSILTSEGSTINFLITASDPDGDAVTMGIMNRPVGATFVDNGNSTASFTWTTNFGDAGTFQIQFTGRDAFGQDAQPKFVLVVIDDINRAPVADAGGPYSGIVNLPTIFDGSGSFDPDGETLAFVWDFGDLAAGTGIAPLHSYAAGGVFIVRLTVSDGVLSNSSSTLATIQDVFPARAFLEGGNQTTRLNSGKANTCIQVEPISGSFRVSSVDISLVTLISVGTGSVDRISAQASKTTIGSDRDRNGVDEVSACFGKEDLRLLFSGLSGGRHTVPVSLEGVLLTSGKFRAEFDMDVVASGRSLASSISPNPLTPRGVLTFRLAKPGRVGIQIFDMGGRLVRTLWGGKNLGPGYYDAFIDGRGNRGQEMPSGIYFYRIEALEGVETGRFTVLR